MIWDRKDKRCVKEEKREEVVEVEEKVEVECEEGKGYDKRKLKCRWTKNSRICQRFGALHYMKVDGKKICKCKPGFVWKVKQCVQVECSKGQKLDPDT